jgi:hypothetical protein
VFDAELFGFTATQYWQLASVILAPTLGFVFLFLLNRPLKKLPFIDTGDDYQPPRWVLPAFAISALFTATMAISVSTFLLLMHSHSADQTLSASYQLERLIKIPENPGPLRLATLTLKQYDGYSNLDLFINGYMAFSTETSCAMRYQCNSKQNSSDFEEKYAPVAVRYGPMHNISNLNSLPLDIDVSRYVELGENHVDIMSSNSGIGDCNVDLAIKLKFESSQVSREPLILPAPNNNLKKIDEDMFYSYGSLPNKLIEPYLTRTADVSYMLLTCH